MKIKNVFKKKRIWIPVLILAVIIWFNIGYCGLKSWDDGIRKEWSKLNFFQKFQSSPLKLSIDAETPQKRNFFVDSVIIVIWPLFFILSLLSWVSYYFVIGVWEVVKFIWWFVFKGGFFDFISQAVSWLRTLVS